MKAIKQNAVDDRVIPVADWLAEGLRLFGEFHSDWRFQCPVCGHIQTGGDFKALKLEPQKVYRECIGRHLPDSARNLGETAAKDGSKSPCDYAAYGLFSFGRQIMPDGGTKPTTVFPFAAVKGGE